MEYTKELSDIVDFSVGKIKENGYGMDEDDLNYILNEKYGYDYKGQNVLESLENDGTVRKCGERLVKLTDKGCKLADKGLCGYKK